MTRVTPVVAIVVSVFACRDWYLHHEGVLDA